MFELVPMFGPILSVVPAVSVALFMPFPTVVWVVLLFLVIQQVENTVFAPRISGHAVELHPRCGMFALLASFQLAGLLGGLFAGSAGKRSSGRSCAPDQGHAQSPVGSPQHQAMDQFAKVVHV